MRSQVEIHVLLIEDNATDALLLQATLDEVPEVVFTVTQATRLAEALDHLQAERFDVVLLDLGLPDSSGPETFLRLRQHGPLVPVLVLTGLDDEAVGMHTLQEGAQDYLVKHQLQAQTLGRAIRYAIERHRISAELDLHSRKLAESEARTRALLEANADAVVIVDTQYNLQFVNPAAERLFGRPASALLGTSFLTIKERPAEVTIAPSTGEPLVAEMRVVETVWHDMPAYLASLRDITARKAMETALRDSEHRFRQLAEFLPQLVWTLTAAGAYDFLSPQLLAYTGMPEAQQLSCGWLQQMHSDDRDPARAAWQAAVASGSNLHCELRIQRHDGVYRWFDTRAVPVRNATGQVVKWFGSYTDIHETYEMCEMLRSFQERLLLALDVGSMGTWVWDIPRAQVWGDDAVFKLFGRTRAELADGQLDTLLSLVHSDDQAQVQTALEAIIQQGCDLDVDDEAVIVMLAARMLQHIGYTVTTYTDPVEALTAFQARPHNVVIVDLAMPKLSGFELAQSLGATRADVPIMMTSGYLSPQDRETASQLGIRTLLPKPYTVEELGQALAQVVPEAQIGVRPPNLVAAL